MCCGLIRHLKLYHLLGKNTIDDRVYNNLIEKLKTLDALVDKRGDRTLKGSTTTEFDESLIEETNITNKPNFANTNPSFDYNHQKQCNCSKESSNINKMPTITQVFIYTSFIGYNLY